jgi:hypothetical protein
MAAEGTHEAINMVSEVERIRVPLEYPEHDDLGHEDPLISEGTITDYITGRTEPFTAEGRKAIRVRIEPLFEEVKKSTGQHPTIQSSVATKRSRSQTVPSGSSSPSWHAMTLRAPILMRKALPTRSS